MEKRYERKTRTYPQFLNMQTKSSFSYLPDEILNNLEEILEKYELEPKNMDTIVEKIVTNTEKK